MKPIPGRYGRYADNGDFKIAFGLTPEAKWPSSGFAPIVIEGWPVWVTPAPRPQAPTSHRYKSSAHRVMTECPTCRKVFSAGRIRQHITVHLEPEAK